MKRLRLFDCRNIFRSKVTQKTNVRSSFGMDPESKSLCDALNYQKGIKTIESCCGHGVEQFRIWFVAKSLKHLPNVLYWFDACHCGFANWRIVALTDCEKAPVRFMIEGPIGAIAYQQSEVIAELLYDNFV